MIVISLQSGSNGNAVYVECPGEGESTRVLLDAGIGVRTAAARLRELGRDIGDIQAVIISHYHADHVRSASAYARRLGIPVHVAPAVMDLAGRRFNLTRSRGFRTFRPGHTLAFDGLAVETVATPHDAEESVAFVLEHGGTRVGVLTDLGHVFEGLPALVSSLDGLFLESNYDPHMLDSGSYPEVLKRRIRGPGGHISNPEAASLVASAASRRLQWVCLAHLSEHNNTPEIALAASRPCLPSGVGLSAASRYHAVMLPELR